MVEYRGLELLDYFVLIAKWRNKLIVIGLIILIMSYLSVYFLIPPQYKTKSLIVSQEDNSFSAMGMLSKGLSSLPLSSLGFGGLSSNDNYDLFTTIIYSRTNLEHLLEKFDLMNDYGVDEIEKALKIVGKSIEINITDEMAFEIEVSASSPNKSAEMNNYIVSLVNDKVIEFNVMKSRNNRVFIGKRYEEIKAKLKQAEDSLGNFQKKEKLYNVEDQFKSIIDIYSTFEKELITKEIEKSVMEKMIDKNNFQLNFVNEQVDELNKKLGNLKTYGKKNSMLLSLETLPDKGLQFLRLFRNVEILNAMLEFIIPMYEQVKFEEVKDIPVLQIIDSAVPPEKKSYPPRTLFALIITTILLVILTLVLFILENLQKTNNPKIQFIKRELLSFSNKKTIEKKS